MGLFSKKGNSDPAAAAAQPEGALAPADALAGVAVCAMYADGVLAAEESDELAAYLAALDLFRGMDDRALSAVFQRVQRVAAQRGDEGLLDACAAALPERLRPTAFLVAADLVMTDGGIGGEERAFLARVQRKLALPDATAQKILDVLAYKHVA